MVEQRNHNPLVRGPNPFAATKITNDPRWSFFILVYGIWTPAQGSEPRQKGGITPVHRSPWRRWILQGGEAIPCAVTIRLCMLLPTKNYIFRGGQRSVAIDTIGRGDFLF